MTTAIDMHDVEWSYPGFTLGPLDLELQPGVVLGLIGPNGAGKTTLINVLAGLLRPRAGKIAINGLPQDPQKPAWRLGAGFVLEDQAWYDRWSGGRNLDFIGSFYPGWSKERVSSLAERFELNLDKPIHELSKGNKVKLALIAALAHSPGLLVLDEPTAGLDPVVRQEVLDVLWELVEEGSHAILYSTHILSDVARLADELAFIRDGKLTRRETSAELESRWARLTFNSSAVDPMQLPGVRWSDSREGEHVAVTSDRESALAALNQQGAADVADSRMGLEEIAVHILREKDDA